MRNSVMTAVVQQAFDGRKYLNLETRRKSGVVVATPVWFARQGRRFYVYSLADAGKVKRIRNDPRVRIAPCDIRGRLEGEWHEARAAIVDGDDEVEGHRLLDAKYGWMKKIGNFYRRLTGRARAIIAIDPV
jgi:PPOX class probable F420-dependent enzyme